MQTTETGRRFVDIRRLYRKEMRALWFTRGGLSAASAASAILLSGLACSRLIQAVPAAPSQAALPTLESPAATPLPSPPPTPLYQGVTFTSLDAEEKSVLPQFEITKHTPFLSGSDDPRVKAFNEQAAAIVQQASADFKQDLTGVTPPPDSVGSSLDVNYSRLSPPGDILSIRFDMDIYVAGAAHPFRASRTLNFDLERGRDLALNELFRPGSDYLIAISSYCVSELSRRDIGFTDFETGASPSAANYGNWNITADGLLITFEEYQVAPYAAGPQMVTMPFADLRELIEPNGLLAPYLP